MARRTDEADEREALELPRRVSGGDVGTETLDRLERAVDDLAIRYPVTGPAQLIHQVRRYLSYSSDLLDWSVRKTLDEHRRLIVVSAWLSLLAGTVHIDLKQPAAANAGYSLPRASPVMPTNPRSRHGCWRPGPGAR